MEQQLTPKEKDMENDGKERRAEKEEKRRVLNQESAQEKKQE